MELNAQRMCSECMTTDAHFPNINGCKTCASMLSQEEALFWNTPTFIEPLIYNEYGESIGYLAIMPKDCLHQIHVPWYINLIRMFMLE